MNTPNPSIIQPIDDPIAEIHEIRRRLASEHGNDPHRLGEFLRSRNRLPGVKTVRVEKKHVST